MRSLFSLALFRNKAPVPYVTRRESFFAVHKQSDPGVQSLEQYGQVGTLFAIVNRLANTTAQVEWKLYRKQKDGRRRYATPDGDDGRKEVTKHAALDLWNKPNPFMTGQEFTETFQQHVDLAGEGWWIVGRNPSFPGVGPLELWPARPDRMRVVTDANEFLTGYRYLTPDGDEIPLQTDEVIQLRMPNPLDPYRGMGPVQSILVDLDSARYSAEWNRNFFRNGAVPGAVIELPENVSLNDDEFDEFQRRWAETHRGVNNAHRVAMLENGGKFVESKFAQKDMQFAELRGVSSEAIREAFGYPKPMLGSVDDVNRANAEAGEYVFAKWLLKPRLERIKQALNNDLLPMFGATDLEFDYCDPTPENKSEESALLTAKVNALKVLLDAGADPEEACEVVGLPPITIEKPEPPVQLAPYAQPGQQMPGREEAAQGYEEDVPDPSGRNVPENAATHYTAHAENDDNTCGPCRANDGHEYASRAAAYVDYPGGRGYTKCIGAKYGNECRCVVRRSS